LSSCERWRGLEQEVKEEEQMSLIEKLKPAKLPENTFPLLLISGAIYAGVFWLWHHTFAFENGNNFGFLPGAQIQALTNVVIEVSLVLSMIGALHFASAIARRFKKTPQEMTSRHRFGRAVQWLGNYLFRGALYIGLYSVMVWSFDRGPIPFQVAGILTLQYPLRRCWYYWLKFKEVVSVRSSKGTTFPGLIGTFLVAGRGLRRLATFLFAPSSPQPRRRRVN